MNNRTMRLSNHGRLGVLLIIIGILLAVDALVGLAFVYKLWPLLLILLGSGFCGIYHHRSRREAIYVGIGSYLIGIGCLFLYCSVVSWQALSFLWPLFITLLGWAFCLGYLLGRRNSILLLLGLLIISVSIVFFFVFNIHYQLWWTVFILTGLTFLIFDKTRHGS